jgi:hypothetical protein
VEGQQVRATIAEAKAALATTEASAAKTQASQATATTEAFETRLRRLESAAVGQAQR